MRNGLFLTALILAGTISSLSAEVRLGLRLNNHAQSDNGQFHLTLGPVLGIMLNGAVEIAPEVAGMFYHDDNGNNRDENRGGILAGCGVYFHPVNADRFSLSIGPRVYVESLFGDYFSVGVAAPVNCDLLVNDTWTVRLGIELANLNFWDGGNNDNTTWDLNSISTPSFTVFYTF